MQEENKLSIPIAIVLAGLFIAVAVFFSRGGTEPSANPSSGQNAPQKDITIKPVTSADHILGNPNAPVVIVEYSDLECPFCKTFHATLHQIMGEYGDDGRVAWVYRHFPLTQLHSKAVKEAEATECAAELGGNAGFWKFTDALFEITPSNDRLDLAQLPAIAKQIGLDADAFSSCLSSGKYTSKVNQAYQDALATGGTGTPYSIVIAGKQQIVIEGAQSYAGVKSVIDSLLKGASSGAKAVPAIVPAR